MSWCTQCAPYRKCWNVCFGEDNKVGRVLRCGLDKRHCFLRGCFSRQEDWRSMARGYADWPCHCSGSLDAKRRDFVRAVNPTRYKMRGLSQRNYIRASITSLQLITYTQMITRTQEIVQHILSKGTLIEEVCDLCNRRVILRAPLDASLARIPARSPSFAAAPSLSPPQYPSCNETLHQILYHADHPTRVDAC